MTTKEIALTICEKIQNEYPKRPIWQTMLEIEDLIDKHLAAINYTRCCKSDSELLCEHPMSERADIFGSYRTYCLKCSTTL